MDFKHNFEKCNILSGRTPPPPSVTNVTLFFFEGFPYLQMYLRKVCTLFCRKDAALLVVKMYKCLSENHQALVPTPKKRSNQTQITNKLVGCGLELRLKCRGPPTLHHNCTLLPSLEVCS